MRTVVAADRNCARGPRGTAPRRAASERATPARVAARDRPRLLRGHPHAASPPPASPSTPTTSASTTRSPTTRFDRGFDAAKALGAEVITASTTLRLARRLVPFAEKHGMPVAMHNHSNLKDPNEFATPGELHLGAGDVAAFPRQPRHRPLHRCQFRPARLPRGAPRQRSPTCISRTARRTRATPRRGDRATRRSAKRCCG